MLWQGGGRYCVGFSYKFLLFFYINDNNNNLIKTFYCHRNYRCDRNVVFFFQLTPIVFIMIYDVRMSYNLYFSIMK